MYVHVPKGCRKWSASQQTSNIFYKSVGRDVSLALNLQENPIELMCLLSLEDMSSLSPAKSGQPGTNCQVYSIGPVGHNGPPL